MATFEQRLEALEQAVNNSRITPQLAQLISVQGTEQIVVYSPEQGILCKYPYADVIASGSVDPTNDIVPVFKQMPNPDFSLDIPTQIASYINNETDFTKTGSQVIFYFVTRKILNSNSVTGFDFQREFYLFSKPKGTYGATSGVTILSTELVKQTPNIDASGSIQEININATSPYDIQTVVNGATVFTPIPSATIIFNISVGGGNEYYLYQGPTDADMGTGGYASVAGDYIDLQTANADPLDFSIPQINELKDVNGWAYYRDGETTPTTQTINTTPSKLLIDGLGGTTEDAYLPYAIRGTDQLWDATNDKITPVAIGDSYDLRVDLEISAKSGVPTLLNLVLDIGPTPDGTDGAGSILIVEKIISTAKTPPYSISESIPIFSLSTFKTNGGTIWLSTDTGSVTVTGRGILIKRCSSGTL